MEDQGRDADRRHHVPNIDFAIHPRERDHSRRTGADSQIVRPPIPEALVMGLLGARASSPNGFPQSRLIWSIQALYSSFVGPQG
jgi:hypothetical protein